MAFLIQNSSKHILLRKVDLGLIDFQDQYSDMETNILIFGHGQDMCHQTYN